MRTGSIFYISSRGSSACEWLAKMLSRHPQVVCFRSTRTIPPYPPEALRQDMLPDDFMEGLLECQQATYGEKIFGSAHGYHGLFAKEACEKRGGRFSYIVRHPLSRLHSAYILYLNFYYKNFDVPVENKDIHERVCGVLADGALMKYVKHAGFFPTQQPNQISGNLKNSIKQSVKKVLPASIIQKLGTYKRNVRDLRLGLKGTGAANEKNFAGYLFVTLADEFLGFDHQVFEGCSSRHGIKMEEMVKSPEYFKNHVWPLVAPEIEVTDAYLKSVFSDQQRFNIHRDRALSPKEIWESWPQCMKDVFMKYFEFYNISTICKTFDYDVSFLK